ncbi:MAG TPA: DegV family protein [Candidatus Dormibacteraeota bacterium]|nr:DegV family protein [Candidatus Dormibacteraeota bacterium]
MTRPCSLVVDSGAVLDEGRYAGTQVVPLRIVFGEQVLRDGIDITADSFYARLEIGDVPTTSTPSPGEYLEAFRASDAESDIVCLTIPRSLSAMNESATLAARLFNDSGDSRRVHVVDTGNAAAGFGLVARAAAELVAAGRPADAVLQRVEQARNEVVMLGTLRTLTYLARSGRVPSLVAGITNLLDVRPIFELSKGEARRLALVRGEKRVVRSFQKCALELLDADTPLWLAVFHSGAPEPAAELRDALHAKLTVRRSETITLSPVMGAYTGPGMTGFAAMPLRGAELDEVP